MAHYVGGVSKPSGPPRARIHRARTAATIAEEASVAVLCGLVGVGLFGLVAAVAGVFRPWLVVPGGLALSVGLVLLWGRVDRTVPRRPLTPLAAAAGLLVVVAATVPSLVWPSEHVLTNRDPGVYLDTGRWLARDGTLVIHPRSGPFTGARDLTTVSSGFYARDHGDRLEPQFFHLVPVYLALGQWLGGDALLVRVPVLLGALALTMFFLFAVQVVNRWLAVAATAALGANLAFVHFARDAFSEPVMLAFVFGGLLLFTAARRDMRPKAALVAGLVLGGAAMVRVDAAVYLIGLGPVLVVEALRWHRDVPRRHWYAALASGVLVAVAIAMVDGLLRGRGYLHDLRGDVSRLAALAVVDVVGCALVIAVWPRLGALRARGRRHRDGIARAAAAAVVVAFVALYALWPSVRGRHPGSHGASTGMAARWLGWYLGPPALVLALAGLAVVTWRAVRSEVRIPRLVLLLTFLPPTLLYLVSPRNSLDQPWAMRRFLPVALPGLVLFAMVAVESALWRARRVGHRAATGVRVGAVGAALLVVAWPVATLWPVAQARTQAGGVAAVHDVCAAVGDDAAVVVLPQDSLQLVLPPAIRSFCGVPAVTFDPALGSGRLDQLRAAAARDGRRLFVVARDDAGVRSAAPSATIVRRVVLGGDTALEPTYTERPHRLTDDRQPIVIARLP